MTIFAKILSGEIPADVVVDGEIPADMVVEHEIPGDVVGGLEIPAAQTVSLPRNGGGDTPVVSRFFVVIM